EAVGQAGGLADVEIVESVVVDVGDGDAVVTVDIDAAGAIEQGAPVVGAVLHLGGVGRTSGEGGGGDVDIDGRSGTGLRFIERRPTAETKIAGGGRLPYEVPVADALLAMETGAGAYDFITDA